MDGRKRGERNRVRYGRWDEQRRGGTGGKYLCTSQLPYLRWGCLLTFAHSMLGKKSGWVCDLGGKGKRTGKETYIC